MVISCAKYRLERRHDRGQEWVETGWSLWWPRSSGALKVGSDRRPASDRQYDASVVHSIPYTPTKQGGSSLYLKLKILHHQPMLPPSHQSINHSILNHILGLLNIMRKCCKIMIAFLHSYQPQPVNSNQIFFWCQKMNNVYIYRTREQDQKVLAASI